jgi:hypothetical protein
VRKLCRGSSTESAARRFRLEDYDAISVREWRLFQQDGIDKRKDSGVRADADAQRKHRYQDKSHASFAE